MRKLSKYANNASERIYWSLLKQVPQAPKFLEYPATQVPQVDDCLESFECLRWLKCPSVFSTRMITESLKSAQMGQNFGSLFVRINKSVKNAELTE